MTRLPSISIPRTTLFLILSLRACLGFASDTTEHTEILDVTIDGLLYELRSDSIADGDHTRIERQAWLKRTNQREHLNVPESVSYNDASYPVTAIGYSEYENDDDFFDYPDYLLGLNTPYIKSVAIPATVKRINGGKWGENLENLYIEDLNAWFDIDFDAVSINCPASNPMAAARNVFIEGKPVEDLTVPEGVVRLKYAALYGSCFNSITLPSTLRKIEFRALSDLYDTQILNITDLGTWCAVDIVTDRSITVYPSGKKSIFCHHPFQNVKTVYFAGEELHDALLPESVTRISLSAFSYLNTLETVEVTSPEFEADYDCFKNCGNFRFLKVGSWDQWFSLTNPYSFTNDISRLMIAETAAINIRNVTVPEYITELPAYSLYKLPATVVYLPAGLKKIGDYSLSQTRLQNVTLPEGLETIGHSAFAQCLHLRNIHLPETLKEIGGNAFINCVWLTSIDAPESVTTVGGGAFRACNSLTYIGLPGVKTLEPETFKDCKNLEYLYLPRLDTIKSRAFSGCSFLKELILPERLKKVETLAFEDCTGLKSVKFPSSMETLEIDAFQGCENLETIDYGNGLRCAERPYNSSIGSNYSLRVFTLGTDIATISRFSGMDNIKTIRILNPIPPTAISCGFNYRNTTLVIPDGEEAMQRYSTHTFWSRFLKVITESEWQSGIHPTEADNNFYTLDGNILTLSVTASAAAVHTLDWLSIHQGPGTIILPKGIYIITSGNKAVKVAIQ